MDSLRRLFFAPSLKSQELANEFAVTLALTTDKRSVRLPIAEKLLLDDFLGKRTCFSKQSCNSEFSR